MKKGASPMVTLGEVGEAQVLKQVEAPEELSQNIELMFWLVSTAI